MMKPCVMGLKTSTQYDIECTIMELEEEGNIVVHKTLRSNGKKLPYNGVLYINRTLKAN